MDFQFHEFHFQFVIGISAFQIPIAAFCARDRKEDRELSENPGSIRVIHSGSPGEEPDPDWFDQLVLRSLDLKPFPFLASGLLLHLIVADKVDLRSLVRRVMKWHLVAVYPATQLPRRKEWLQHGKPEGGASWVRFV